MNAIASEVHIILFDNKLMFNLMLISHLKLMKWIQRPSMGCCHQASLRSQNLAREASVVLNMSPSPGSSFDTLAANSRPDR